MRLEIGQTIAIKWHVDDEECIGRVIEFERGYCIILTLDGERVPFRQSSLCLCKELDPTELELPVDVFWKRMIKKFGGTNLYKFLGFSFGAAILVKYVCIIL